MPVPASFQETILTPKASRTVEAEWSFVAQTSGRSLVLPDGRCDVILRDNLDSTAAATMIVTGPSTQPYWVDMHPQDRWRGIRMRPEKARALWQSDIGTSANTVLRGDAAAQHFPTLSQTRKPTPETVPDSPIDARITTLIDLTHTSGGRLRIADMARLMDLSTRHLGRLFTAHVGLPVKTYAQLVQFHRALRLLTDHALTLADVVFEAGFADHAHMTRTFQRFGGFVPSRIPPDLFVPRLFPK